MKKILPLLASGLLGLAALTLAQAAAQNPPAEATPTQKAMQARMGWLKAMAKNLGANNLPEVAKDAGALAAQTAKAAVGAEGERKEMSQKVSDLAAAASEAAGKGEAEALQARLGEIKAACAACHDKYRDKK